MKYIFTIASLLFLCHTVQAQQTVEDGIHSIMIFEYDGFKSVLIKQHGETPFGETINVKKLNKKIAPFLADYGYSKEAANNDPPAQPMEPTKGLKNVYITILLEKDFVADKDYMNPTVYSKSYLNVAMDFYDYDILKLLSKKDRAKILKQLQQ
jgi:hypothetical protein